MSNNPVYSLLATPRSFGLLFLRIHLAVIFFFHGSQKAFGLFGGKGWSATLEQWTSPDGLGIPYFFAAAAVVSEILIAVSMFFGFLTRVAAVGVVAIMTGAILYVHAGQGFVANEFPVTIMVIGVALMLMGGGRLSMDRGLSKLLLPAFG